MSREPRVGILGSGILLALRLALGGLFVLAAYQKLFSGPFASQTFSESIRAFRVVEDVELVRLATFMIPWVELFAGLALILGLWTRAAAMVIGLLLSVFISGIVSVELRGLVADCSCFGKYKLLCGNEAIPLFKGTKPVGWCKVGEDAAMALMAAALWAHGGGIVALDRLCGGRKARTSRPKD